MNYCCQVSVKIPHGDVLPRFVCTVCQMIHYQNPKIVVGCLPEWQDQILLCRRAIDPRTGFWTFPAGFMETGESTDQAAARETLEEAKAHVDIISLYAVFSLPHISQVYVVFRGNMRRPDCGVGSESMEVQFFHPDKVPWESLAFPVISETLARYVHDRNRGRFEVHTGIVPPRLV